MRPKSAGGELRIQKNQIGRVRVFHIFRMSCIYTIMVELELCKKQDYNYSIHLIFY